MDDLISRQAAIDIVLSVIPYDEYWKGQIEEAVGNLPHAQPERKKGEWIWQLADNGWVDHICSVCGYTENTDIHVSLGWKYCPNCGAKLEGADDEND